MAPRLVAVTVQATASPHPTNGLSPGDGRRTAADLHRLRSAARRHRGPGAERAVGSRGCQPRARPVRRHHRLRADHRLLPAGLLRLRGQRLHQHPGPLRPRGGRLVGPHPRRRRRNPHRVDLRLTAQTVADPARQAPDRTVLAAVHAPGAGRHHPRSAPADRSHHGATPRSRAGPRRGRARGVRPGRGPGSRSSGCRLPAATEREKCGRTKAGSRPSRPGTPAPDRFGDCSRHHALLRRRPRTARSPASAQGSWARPSGAG